MCADGAHTCRPWNHTRQPLFCPYSAPILPLFYPCSARGAFLWVYSCAQEKTAHKAPAKRHETLMSEAVQQQTCSGASHRCQPGRGTCQHPFSPRDHPFLTPRCTLAVRGVFLWVYSCAQEKTAHKAPAKRHETLMSEAVQQQTCSGASHRCQPGRGTCQAQFSVSAVPLLRFFAFRLSGAPFCGLIVKSRKHSTRGTTPILEGGNNG